MIRAIKYSLILISLLSEVDSKAQDPFFSQSFGNSVYLNPAFAGYDACPNISAGYRIQNPTRSDRSHTFNLSYDQQLGKRHGIYLNYQFDNDDNVITTHELSIGYAPAFWIANRQVMLSPAFEIGWHNRSLNSSNVTLDNVEDRGYNIGYPIYSWPILLEDGVRDFLDFAFGALISYKGLVVGSSFHHITQPDEQFYQGGPLPIRITTHVSYTFKVSESFQVSPSFIYWNQLFHNILPSVSFKFCRARLGVGFRTTEFNTSNSALVFMGGYQGNGFSVGYSYDFSISPFSDNQFGGRHELTVGYVFGCKKESQRKGVQLINF